VLRLPRVALACLLALLVPATVHAQQQYSYTAHLSAPSKKQGTVVASGIKWVCKGKTCRTRGPWPEPGIGACAALRAQTGATIKAYGYPKHQLSAKGLARCNGTTTQQAPAVTKVKPEVMQRMLKKSPTLALKKPSTAAPAAGAASSAASSTPRTYPFAVTTQALTVTGIGRLETAEQAAARAAFTPKRVRTTGLTVTGTGALESAEDTARREAFEPKRVRTAPLTVTGTGHL
jgi:hypothetical protein